LEHLHVVFEKVAMADSEKKGEMVNGKFKTEPKPENITHVPYAGVPRYVEETDDVLLDVGAAKLEDGSLSGLKLAKDRHVKFPVFQTVFIESNSI
jgi:hypothetical protein